MSLDNGLSVPNHEARRGGGWSDDMQILRDHIPPRRFLERFHDLDGRWGWRRGVTSRSRPRPVVVTLTSVAARLDRVHIAVSSLLAQRERPDAVVLWLDHAIGTRGLTAPLRRLRRRGLDVQFVEDVGPHTKLWYALRRMPEALLVTADDDRIYPRGWLGGLLAAHRRHPGAVVCYRAHRMRPAPGGTLAPYRDWTFYAPGETGPSHWLFPTGTGGVLYPPGALHPDVFDRDAMRRLSPRADDVWYKAMALRAGTPTVKVHAHYREFPSISGTQADRLWTDNRVNNDAQIDAVFTRYGLYAVLAAERDAAGAASDARAG